MSYLTDHAFRHGNNDFWARVETAILNTADNLLNEDPQTVNHANRLAWAQSVYASPDAPAGVVNRLKNRISQHWKLKEVGPAIPDTGQDALQAVCDYVATTFDMAQS